MQLKASIGTLVSLFALTSVLSGQTTVDAAQVASDRTLQRDPQALALLAQTTLAGGGQEAIASIRDFVETGTITYYLDKEMTGQVTIKGRGFDHLKMIADLPTGRQTTLIAGSGGKFQEAEGRVRPLHRQGGNDLKAITIPSFTLVGAQQNASTSILYRGLVTHNGVQVHDVRLQQVYDRTVDPTGNRGVDEARDIYIDPSTYFIIAISDALNFGGPPVPHEILYSDYRTENGVALPHALSETIRGVTNVTINVNHATFNVGLADSEFDK
jgi:hypothetical protein